MSLREKYIDAWAHDSSAEHAAEIPGRVCTFPSAQKVFVLCQGQIKVSKQKAKLG